MKKKIAVALLLLAMVVIMLSQGWADWFTLDNLNGHLQTVRGHYAEHPLLTALGFIATYVLAVAMPLPGASLLTLFAGAIFGVLRGTLIVSISSNIGALLSFLVARYLFRDLVEGWLKERLNVVNAGLKSDGPLYLFSLRLMPIFPFFVLNLSFGVTRLPAKTFVAVSFVSMLPASFLLVNAGDQLGAVTSLSEVATPSVLGSMVALGLFPWVVKKALEHHKTKKTLSK